MDKSTVSRFLNSIMRGIREHAIANASVEDSFQIGKRGAINPADHYGHKSRTFKKNKRKGK